VGGDASRQRPVEVRNQKLEKKREICGVRRPMEEEEISHRFQKTRAMWRSGAEEEKSRTLLGISSGEAEGMVR
jgi:hypothetical protein